MKPSKRKGGALLWENHPSRRFAWAAPQYTIEPTADAEERIPYPYKELPIAMFKQMYRPLLGDQIPIHWHEGNAAFMGL